MELDLRGVVSGGAVITNNNGAELTIDGGGFNGIGLNLGSNVTLNNYGTVTISGTLSNIIEGSVNFNNFGTFAGDGVVNASNFDAGGAGATISPGTATIPIGKLTFDNEVDFSNIDLDIQVNGASNYDQLERRFTGAVNITNAHLNLSGTYTPLPGEEFTILNNTTGNAITGTFFDQPQLSTINLNGVALEISYTGGDGDDK